MKTAQAISGLGLAAVLALGGLTAGAGTATAAPGDGARLAPVCQSQVIGDTLRVNCLSLTPYTQYRVRVVCTTPSGSSFVIFSPWRGPGVTTVSCGPGNTPASYSIQFA
ncbi:hypothetical protein [Streptomyces sp. CAU 1734]|uniref:hypothetical protein n=1 Tax=Streptomyces sp. CAU 1734 TaxID=3140360 RepID=UPI003260B6DD